jgi:pyruvate dehydrogenase E1 component beta subunit
VGAAIAGLRPVVELPSDELAVSAMGALVDQAAGVHYLSNGTAAAPVVFRVPVGGSADLRASPSLTDRFSAVPGLKVLLPATPRDARGLLKSAIRDDNPVLFCEDVRLFDSRGEVPEDDETIPIGRADVKRFGADASIVTGSYMVQKALDAAERMAEEGVEVEVLDLRSSLPLDADAILATVERTGRLVIVQETHGPCSVASEVAALVAEHGLYSLDAPIRRVTARWAPIPAAPALERVVFPQTDQIVAAVRAVIGTHE